MTPPIHEQELLGAIIRRPMLVDDVFCQITPKDFEWVPHQNIAEKIILLGERTGVVSLTTTIEDNQDIHNCGGEGYITLLGGTDAGTGISYLVELVRRKAIGRRLREYGKALSKIDGDYNLDEVERDFHKAISTGESGSYFRIDELLPEYIDELEAKRTGKRSELKSGFKEIDDHLGGLHAGNLIIIGGRPGQGKTSFALNLVASIGDVGFFSLEMSRNEVIGKLISNLVSIPYQRLRNATTLGASDLASIAKSVEVLKDKKIYVDDTPGIGLSAIRSKSRRMVRKGVKLIIVDYLQIMGGQDRGQNRAEFIGGISGGLKNLARECKVPVMVLSQLNRSKEYGSDKEPKLHHLRESGSIEQDADSVLFVYRPDEIDTPDDAQIIIAKNRHGSLAKLDYRFVGAYGRFKEWQPGEKPEKKDDTPRGRR